VAFSAGNRWHGSHRRIGGKQMIDQREKPRSMASKYRHIALPSRHHNGKQHGAQSAHRAGAIAAAMNLVRQSRASTRWRRAHPALRRALRSSTRTRAARILQRGAGYGSLLACRRLWPSPPSPQHLVIFESWRGVSPSV
jgi:hypothetical protein